ncbi:MAG: polyamine aminopropyltransferase [Bdellovibrionales bacterium]
MNALGRHILVEFTDCNSDILNDVDKVEKSMVEAAKTAGATVINSTFHHFSPWGISGVVVIQESHLAIHTWPEFGYAAVDLFTCGETVNPWVSFEHLKKAFKSNKYSALEMNRGSLHLMKREDFKPKKRNTAAPLTANDQYKISRNVWFTDKDDQQALSLRYNEVLFNETSPFQQVRVFDTPSFGRMLTINNMVMCTERDESHYHEMIVHPAMQLLPKAENILVIGGGDGGTIREVLKYPQVKKVTMVEIDEAVVRASQEFLPSLSSAFKNDKLELIIGDGIDFVKKANEAQYDLIIVDGSDPVGPAEGLFTADFYKNCSRALKNHGMLVSQGESPLFHKKTFIDLHRCLKGIFGMNNVHTLLFYASSYPTGMWSFQMASKQTLHPIQSFKSSEAAQFSKTNKLHYYNEDVHVAAFAMPSFVKKMLEV